MLIHIEENFSINSNTTYGIEIEEEEKNRRFHIAFLIEKSNRRVQTLNEQIQTRKSIGF